MVTGGGVGEDTVGCFLSVSLTVLTSHFPISEPLKLGSDIIYMDNKVFVKYRCGVLIYSNLQPFVVNSITKCCVKFKFSIHSTYA